jgi:hypothetical protein
MGSLTVGQTDKACDHTAPDDNTQYFRNCSLKCQILREDQELGKDCRERKVVLGSGGEARWPNLATVLL